ncbi:MAG: hypothetical protein AAF828_03515 [Bacteroidota bacterium]
MLKQLLFIAGMFICLHLSSQAAFPADYLGVWKGALEIYNSKGLQQAIPMQLHMQPITDSTYTYTLIYGPDIEKGTRDYMLRPGKKGPHHWVVDEKDGILLDNFYLGGVLYGPFSVMSSTLNTSMELKGKELHYTIFGGPTEAFATSGTVTNENGEEKEIKVESFEVTFLQRAVLKRSE